MMTTKFASIMAQYDQARNEWKTISRQVVDGRIADTRQGRSMALDLSLGQAKAKFEEMRDYLDQLTEINQRLAIQSKKNAADSYHHAVVMLLLILATGISMGIVMAWVIGRNITRPVNAAVAGPKDIAEGEGDLTKRLEVQSKDEVGELAVWFNTFLDKLQGIIKEISDKAKQLGLSSGSLSDLSAQMSSGADKMSSKSDAVASAAEEMSVSMQSVAAAMEQASTNVNMVAAATADASGLAALFGAPIALLLSLLSPCDPGASAISVRHRIYEQGY
jgi:methyl-accepting chemotaxis protein